MFLSEKIHLNLRCLRCTKDPTWYSQRARSILLFKWVPSLAPSPWTDLNLFILTNQWSPRILPDVGDLRQLRLCWLRLPWLRLLVSTSPIPLQRAKRMKKQVRFWTQQFPLPTVWRNPRRGVWDKHQVLPQAHHLDAGGTPVEVNEHHLPVLKFFKPNQTYS